MKSAFASARSCFRASRKPASTIAETSPLGPSSGHYCIETIYSTHRVEVCNRLLLLKSRAGFRLIRQTSSVWSIYASVAAFQDGSLGGAATALASAHARQEDDGEQFCAKPSVKRDQAGDASLQVLGVHGDQAPADWRLGPKSLTLVIGAFGAAART
ncbi:hypothetical protein G8D25_13370 [Ralstonia solanacearum]|uniref:hypothetical protein n=1 Tax=Ralstonia solanacearum TaxID=305 RepID=UPI001449BEAB|nr:hypothetical protein [Ralstonia solanacearum]QJC25115.1 hypothetical protein G8D25_13370 [Ralstonia solanacearum]